MPRSKENHVCQTRPSTVDRDRRDRIRELNDRLRISGLGGHVMITSGLQALGNEVVQEVLAAVHKHDRFDGGNDPYGEHDFGSLSWKTHKLLWKIDYYDTSLEFGSPDPADTDVTTRVLTVMLASEY